VGLAFLSLQWEIWGHLNMLGGCWAESTKKWSLRPYSEREIGCLVLHNSFFCLYEFVPEHICHLRPQKSDLKSFLIIRVAHKKVLSDCHNFGDVLLHCWTYADK
jgi:hypothetical protein